MQLLTGIINALPGAVSQGTLWGVMVLGVYITFEVLHHADLTVDGSFALGGAVSAVLITTGVNPFVSLIAAFLAGALAGTVTGLLHTKLKIPGILAGILSMIALYSINIRVMGSSNTPLNGLDTFVARLEAWPVFKAMGKTVDIGWFTVSARSLICIVVGITFCAAIIALMYWFFGTEVGCAIRATGSNERMVRALGSNTDNMKIMGLLLSNALVSLSGALVAQSQGYGDVGMGTGTIVVGLASVIIGQVIFGHGSHSFGYYLVSVVMGSIIYYMVIAIVLQLGLRTTDLKMLTAVIVALSLSLPAVKSYIAKRKSGGRTTAAKQ